MDWFKIDSEGSVRDKQLLETGLWADCTFLVGEETIGAHKLMLAMASPVFAAMFFDGEAKANNHIRETHMQPKAFKAMLEFIYTEKIKIIDSMKIACEIWYGAKKFEITNLEEKIVEFCILKHLGLDNVCLVYDFVIVYGNHSRFYEKVLKKCVEIIKLNTTELVNSSQFEQLHLKTVQKLFSMDQLLIDSELVLLDAVDRYTLAAALGGIAGRVEVDDQGDTVKEDKASITIRDIVKEIRLLSLSAQQLSDIASRSALLSAADAAAVLAHARGEPMPAGFSTSREPRCPTVKIKLLSKVPWLESRGISREFSLEADSSRSEILFQMKIKRVSELKMAVSEIFNMNNLPCRVVFIFEKEWSHLDVYLTCAMGDLTNIHLRGRIFFHHNDRKIFLSERYLDYSHDFAVSFKSGNNIKRIRREEVLARRLKDNSIIMELHIEIQPDASNVAFRLQERRSRLSTNTMSIPKADSDMP